MLTDTAIKKAQPRANAYRLTDERGLHMLVQPNGSKLWQLRYRHSGKEKTAALGQYPDISLREACDRRDAVRKTGALGIDPVAKKSELLTRPTPPIGLIEMMARSLFNSQVGTLDLPPLQ